MTAEITSPLTGLTVKQQLCIEAIIEGCTLTEAARRAGVTGKTVWNWRQTAHFMAAIDRKMQERSDASGTQGLTLVPECIKVLKTIMQDQNEEAADRIRAASVIMASANTFKEQRELETYVAHLEARLRVITSATSNTHIERINEMHAAGESDEQFVTRRVTGLKQLQSAAVPEGDAEEVE